MASRKAMSPLERIAKQIVQREMNSYDLLSRRAKLRYEEQASEVVPTFVDRGICACAHGVMLHEPCTKCCRTQEDCKVYHDAMLARVRELLAILDRKEGE